MQSTRCDIDFKRTQQRQECFYLIDIMWVRYKMSKKAPSFIRRKSNLDGGTYQPCNYGRKKVPLFCVDDHIITLAKN